MTSPGSRILIVDDERPICELLVHLFGREGMLPVIALDGERALEIIRLAPPHVLIVDFKLPGMDGFELLRRAKELDEDLPAIVITGYADVRGAVAAMKAGAHDYLAKPFNNEEVVRVVLRALGEGELKRKLKCLSSRIQHDSLRELMGTSESVSQLALAVNRVAKSDFSVVILGETGSGKELIARAIHQASSRSKGPFVAVDCGAIPESLLESELFGYEKGAFTGAFSQRSGKLEAAADGTLFLDEISNMPLSCQPKLLRVFQDKAVYHIGSSKPIRISDRVVAASNVDLLALTQMGSFRSDLFFRLNEFTITVPPLRERKQDILYLARRFLDLTNLELNKCVRDISRSAVDLLLSYSWPGNVRQLRSTIRRAVLMANDVITEQHLDLGKGSDMQPISRSATARWAGGPLKDIVRRSTIEVERDVLIRVLRKTGGNKAKAARLLQIDYKTIHSKVKEYGIAVNEGESDYEERLDEEFAKQMALKFS